MPRFIRPALLATVVILSFLNAVGCRSVFAQGSYNRVGVLRLESLAEAQQAELKSAIVGVTDPADRVQALWLKALDFETRHEFKPALAAFEEIRRGSAPAPAELKSHLIWCRAQLAVARRWTDPDLRRVAQEMDLNRGLSLYRQVARTVASDYVDELSYADIVDSGLLNLRAAMSNQAFLNQWQVTADLAQRTAFMAALEAAGRRLHEEKRPSSFTARSYLRQVCEASAATIALPAGVIISEFIFGAAEQRDSYSSYLTNRMYRSLMDDLGGKFVGLGVEVREVKGQVLIVGVFKNGPADAAGIKAGDYLTAVDDTPVGDKGIDGTVTKLRGPAGTQMKITVKRGEELLSFAATRGPVEVPSVRLATRVGPQRDIGYLRIATFQRATARETEQALSQLESEGPLAGLVIDLRNNPGGLVDAAVDLCSLFLDKGTIVTTKGRAFGQTQTYGVNRWLSGRHNQPLVILVNEMSASASEIVAGALRDRGRATLVGSRTFGKGLVQTIIPLESGQSAICLTTARYYAPNNESFQDVGVTPQVLVDAAALTDETEALTDQQILADRQAPNPATDNVLRRALAVLAEGPRQAALPDRSPLSIAPLPAAAMTMAP